MQRVWRRCGERRRTTGRSFIGFDRRSGRGVVILHNGVTNTDDIGFHLLDSRFPLAASPAPPRTRVEITLDEDVVQACVGEYDLVPGFVLTITREGRQLFLQATGQGRLPLFADFPRKPAASLPP